MTATRPFTESGIESPERRRRVVLQLLIMHCLRQSSMFRERASEQEQARCLDAAEDAHLVAEEFVTVARRLRLIEHVGDAFEPLLTEWLKREQAND